MATTALHRSTGPNQNILSQRGTSWCLETRTPDEIELDNWKEEAGRIFSDTYGVVLTGWFNDGAADECAHDAGLTPQEFAYQQGDTYGLTPRKGYRPEVKKARKTAKKAAKQFAAVTASFAHDLLRAICEAPFVAEAEAQLVAHVAKVPQCGDGEEYDYEAEQGAYYETIGRRQADADDAYHSYKKWLNDDRDEYGRW